MKETRGCLRRFVGTSSLFFILLSSLLKTFYMNSKIKNRKKPSKKIFIISLILKFKYWLGYIGLVAPLFFIKDAKRIWFIIFLISILSFLIVFVIQSIKRRRIEWKMNNLLHMPLCLMLISTFYLISLWLYEVRKNYKRDFLTEKALRSTYLYNSLKQNNELNIDHLNKLSQFEPAYKTCLGRYYGEIQLYVEARECFASTATFDPEAAFYLGICHLLGLGGPINKNYGIRLLKQAAENEHVDAQEILSRLYIMGNGTEADIREALYWNERVLSHTSGYAGLVGILQKFRRVDIYNRLGEYRLVYNYCRKQWGKDNEELFYVVYSVACKNLGNREEAFLYAGKAYARGIILGGLLLGIYYQEDGPWKDLAKAEDILLNLAVYKRNKAAAKELQSLYEENSIAEEAAYWRELLKMDLLFEK